MGGFNLPPGCSVADIDRAMGIDGAPCEVCLCDPEVDCRCEECPVCHSYGDPNCYEPGHWMSGLEFSLLARSPEPTGWIWNGVRFRLILHPEIVRGRIGRQKLFDIWQMENLQWEEMYAREMDEGNEVERIADKWR